jgi:glycerol-3-phosphate O-acyltransferase
MNKINDHIIPRVEDWPVAKQSRERATFIQNLNAFVIEQIQQSHGNNLTDLISRTCIAEMQRVKTMPWKVDPVDDSSYWKRLNVELEEASHKSDRKEIELQILRRIVNRYNEEIVGGFNPRTFKGVRVFLLSFFKRLLGSYFSSGQWRWGGKKQLQEKIVIQGNVEKIRHLFEKGTVVVLPTHYSNLDSIMVGYAIDLNVGLPSFAYGAGLNLYNYEIVAYLINRMGAFRVDRRKKNPIYLECLKSMTSYSVYEGTNCIFFPGGTRSRSGETEDKLKLGLINSLIEAQRMYLEKGSDRKIYVVPLNIGYHFVLEANSLIDQHLTAIGQGKYIRSRSIGPSMITISRFFKDLFGSKSEVYLSFGEPMDVLGNVVDNDGNSCDRFGHHVDISEYFSWDGKLTNNNQREGIYAKKLGESVVQAFRKNNPILSSNVIAFVTFHLIYENYKGMSIISLTNLKGQKYTIDYDAFRTHVIKLIALINKKAENGDVLRSYENWDNPDEIIKSGFEKLGIYHASRAMEMTKDSKILSRNIKLLYFYHNRLTNYDFEELMGWPKV